MTDQPDIVSNRQARASGTFVELIDTLVDDFDVIDMMTVLASRCVELLDAAEAGILLVDGSGHLRVVAASSEKIELLELFQVQNEQGPCLDCFRTGRVVAESDLEHSTTWPQFGAESVAAGMPSVCAVPLRLRSVILGGLNLFMSRPVPLSPADLHLAQALADVASIAIIQDQAARDAAARESRLQHALESRIVIEQAKGMLSEHSGTDMDASFEALRGFARSHNRRLTEVAESLTAGTLPIASVWAHNRQANTST
ncbi:MAG TPA: GAF and ANTAR domain-containing protein [Ilumatobacteraceae bacterium]